MERQTEREKEKVMPFEKEKNVGKIEMVGKEKKIAAILMEPKRNDEIFEKNHHKIEKRKKK